MGVCVCRVRAHATEGKERAYVGEWVSGCVGACVCVCAPSHQPALHDYSTVHGLQL
jgi:hypothetical protein